MSEFMRMLALDEIGAGVERRITATPQERAALAARFDLLSLDRLEADLTATPTPGGVRVKGRVEAEAVQACATSGEDVPARIDEPVELLFLHDVGQEGEEVELRQADCDVLPIEGRSIDIGEAASQTFGLALDPYPRADTDAVAAARRKLLSEEEAAARESAEKANANPFAVLKRNR
ncbi:YceD family protein [Sphingosinicella soli]|uniref:Uncharacterized metal-binding protein YceD (DUF177 family) n=1 Tax=Sphingosinicella soli TaxID=333708 RepID=A0A7W7B3J4_9SPHN|nr:DUF177 domain-containing protein [Sphingosinicella soli]MBB4632478.1 uncharacterized metal-binding protein YceD (DUF177 family) [Sphingosinicella soli]